MFRHPLPALALTTLLTLAGAPAGAQTTAIENVRVFDGTNVTTAQTVVLEGRTILAVGPHVDVPEGAARVDGSGKTLLPGLIDGHTHAFGPVLEDALNWGVTTELDMFTEWRMAQSLRKAQKSGAPGRADLFSAGTLVTAQGGHGTQFGLQVPTLDRLEDTESHIAARIEEGSDYIKLVLEDGSTIGREINTLADDTFVAAVRAAQERGKLAVVHVSSLEKALLAAGSGADGLVHIHHEGGPSQAFTELARKNGMFVTPTLAVIETMTGGKGGGEMADDETLQPFLSPNQLQSLRSVFGRSDDPEAAANRLQPILDTVRQLHEAGVPILAGTDAPNPGTAHGVSMHREMELLVQAGLSPADALAAATSRPAAAYGLADRGRIAPGLKANLLLVAGDPTQDIRATREIDTIWKDGVRFDRLTFDAEESEAPATAPGLISSFDARTLEARFGSWMPSTDTMAGGESTLDLSHVDVGAGGSSGALKVEGELVQGFAFPWSGPMFSPGSRPMEAVDMSAGAGIAFQARGSGKARFMIFSQSIGQMPAQTEIVLTEDWSRHEVTFESLDLRGDDIMGFLISGAALGPFTFEIDEVELMPSR